MDDPTGETAPRGQVFDNAFSLVWDETILDKAPSPGKGPEWWRLASEILRRGSEYDAVVTWGEKLTLAVAAQQRFARTRKPHIAMMYYFDKPNIKYPMRLFGNTLHGVVTWTTVQRRVLIDDLHFPSERAYLVRHYVDQLFYSPRQADEDMICAVGAEMRDYATFVEAVRGTDLRCHIATDHVRIPGKVRLINDRRLPIGDIVTQTDAQITSGRMSLPELRKLYARSKFVVVPLLPSDSDNGVTVILEAMAMGKPVICSRTRGQVDVVQDGVTGLYVPVGDAAALRAAMLSLWNDPQRAQEMGHRARAYIEAHHTLEMFTSGVRSAVEASLDGRPAPDTWWV
ncbi:MAG: glycosyltransferase family 4 protein [Proteobacteria bacterium]|nr:glycosyltransferase family 4 protein [Pseudomonadota bacterium]